MPSNKKQVTLIALLFVIVVLVFFRFIPIDSKYIFCQSGEYRIIKGELKEYNSLRQPSADDLNLMGLCAKPSTGVNLYLF